jgi:hypothetical protein
MIKIILKRLDQYLDMPWEKRDRIRFRVSGVISIVCLFYCLVHRFLEFFPFFDLPFSVDFRFVLILVLFFHFSCFPGNKNNGGNE